MIFITLGSQKFQFNRLLKKVDELVEKGLITSEVFAQKGYSDYEPKNFECKDFLDRSEFSNLMGKAELVITHGGTGAIVTALKSGKRVIGIPRLCKYKEHVDDHQKEIVSVFSEAKMILSVDEIDELDECIERINKENLNKFKSNNDSFVQMIEEMILS